MSDGVAVSIHVRDESGLAIPHATVWGATEYDPDHLKDFGPYQSLKIEDLWRVAERYGSLHDIITEYGDKPLTMLRVRQMGDGAGLYTDTLDYQAETGKGHRHRRPDPLCFGLVFLKHGYLPGRMRFEVGKGQNKVDAVVSLQRDPGRAPETQACLRAYDEIRYQLSNTTRNAAMTMANHQRLEELKARLEETALAAIAAGDPAAAARMYVRLSFAPQVIFQDGRICGFSQARPRQDLMERALDRAFELDPDSLYLAMRRYGREVKRLDKLNRVQRCQARLELVQSLIERWGERVWPVYFEIRAMCYAELGDIETACRLYREAKEMEPKFMDWEGEISDMKRRLKKKE